MVSHLIDDGGTFLPPHGRVRNGSTTRHQHGRSTRCEVNKAVDWAADTMKRYKETGDIALKDQLLVHYMSGFVTQIAIRIASVLPKNIDPEDLAHEAFVGLSDCIEKYDPSLNSRFEGYSRLRIAGAMKDHLRRVDPASRLARQRSKMIGHGIEEFKTRHGRPPTDEELQHRLQLNPDEFDAVMKDVRVPCTVSFQQSDNDSEEDGMASLHSGTQNLGISRIDREDLHRWLCQQLGHYDKLIVALYYTENLSMMEIGESLGFSESRISQRLKHIHDLLKIKMIDYPELELLMAC